jgi:LmbE family N-acetylglucosaminyl deacetylase
MATATTKMLVISPHLDDGVLSCGEQLAMTTGATVATVFGGRPRRWSRRTQWDLDCGFEQGDDVTAVRIGEDRYALEILGTDQVVLSERDVQYHPLPRRKQRVTRALLELLEALDPEECWFPIGIGHPDHVLTRACCLALASNHPRISWRTYTDLPYGLSPRFKLAHRLAREAIANSGFSLEPIPLHRDDEAAALKGRAMACYQSQLRGLASRRTNFILPEQVAVEAHFELTRSPISAPLRFCQPG